ncbi:hypothetical protein NEIG_02300 [Nematocida sp. ERTm5]|nr:hypothetical protein NEIG_02300 [Nematocida sp. ERTm5]
MSIEKITSFESRVQTFETFGWSCSFQDIKTLAHAGFARDAVGGSNDGVICHFCNKALDGWDRTDIPYHEHRIHSPKCILFNLDTTEARARSFKYGQHRIAMKAIKFLAASGVFLYNIEDPNQPHLFCFNCGFNCKIASQIFCKTAMRINELHMWHSSTCAEEVKIEKEARGNKLNKKEYFSCQLVKGKVNALQETRYVIDLNELTSNNIEIHTPSWSHVMTSGCLPKKNLLYAEKEPNKQAPISEISQESEKESHASASKKDRPLSSPEDSISPISSADQRDSAEKEPTESPAMLCVTESPGVLEKKVQIVVPETILDEIRPDELILQLNEFITPEERASLPIKDALALGLSKMLEQIRDITNQDIEDVRQEMSQLLP